MAMKVRYYGVEGELLGDSVAGDYMPDALGSVIGTTSSTTGAVLNTYRYKPYGERLSKTGAADDPVFAWVGTYGYRQTAIAHSASYVRARHYAQEEGRWTTVDSLWPEESAYAYVANGPTRDIDPSGLASCQVLDCPPDVITECVAKCQSIGRRYKTCVPRQGVGAKIYDCYCKCPDPVTSRAQATARGAAELRRKHGKCQKVKTGDRTTAHVCPAQDIGGNHETTTYRCGGRVVTVSIVCCECEKGKFTCFAVVKP